MTTGLYGLRDGWRRTAKRLRRRHLLLGDGVGDVLIAVCRQGEISETITDTGLPLCQRCRIVQDAIGASPAAPIQPSPSPSLNQAFHPSDGPPELQESQA